MKILFGAGEFLTPEFVIKHGISHVINCANDIHSPSWFRTLYPNNYAVINAIDNPHVSILKWFPEFESVMDKFLQSPTCKKVFVHCQAGINRSGFLTLAYICKKFGFEVQSCVRSILIQRPCALSNHSFYKQVITYSNGGHFAGESALGKHNAK
jgi:hypothetical protein